ncbi:MAG: ribosome-associated translation inhibitor RaiA [Firmicutes bacterium]|nr:ribosome-associated translation inhibitor RaiA [Bacillota bacterium]
MKFNIRGNKIDVTPAIKGYIEEKIGRLDKYLENPQDVSATVVIRVRGNEQIVEVTIPIRKVILRGEQSHSDLYAAIDIVSDKMERQIRKNKTKLKKQNSNFVEFNMDFEVETDESEDKAVVKRKTIEMKPMSEEEAILQMELIGHEFFVFKDVDNDNISILYKRKDGDYGIIETK